MADLISAKYGVDKAEVVLGDSGGKTAAVRCFFIVNNPRTGNVLCFIWVLGW